MGVELEEQLGASIELVSSSGGVFEVTVDGELIFSKKSLGRFPEDKEVSQLIRRK